MAADPLLRATAGPGGLRRETEGPSTVSKFQLEKSYYVN